MFKLNLFVRTPVSLVKSWFENSKGNKEVLQWRQKSLPLSSASVLVVQNLTTIQKKLKRHKNQTRRQAKDQNSLP
jgi:hypothetical protein